MIPIHGELGEFESFIKNSLAQNEIKNYYVFRDIHKGKHRIETEIFSKKIGGVKKNYIFAVY